MKTVNRIPLTVSLMTFLRLMCSLFAECRCSTTRRCVRTVIITPAAPDVCSAWVSAPHTSVTHRSRISYISGESNQHSLFSDLCFYFSEANIPLWTPRHLTAVVLLLTISRCADVECLWRTEGWIVALCWENPLLRSPGATSLTGTLNINTLFYRSFFLRPMQRPNRCRVSFPNLLSFFLLQPFYVMAALIRWFFSNALMWVSAAAFIFRGFQWELKDWFRSMMWRRHDTRLQPSSFRRTTGSPKYFIMSI